MQPNDIDFLQTNIQKFYHKIVKHILKKDMPGNLIPVRVFEATQAAIYSLSAYMFTSTHNYTNNLDEEIDEYTSSLNDFIKKHVQHKLKEDEVAS